MPKLKKNHNVPPYRISGRFGIMNHMGSLWTANTFETCEEAEQYKTDYQARNRNCNLNRHTIIPVRVTVHSIKENFVAFDEDKTLAFEHLKNVLYILADLDPGDRCVALDRAQAFYNEKRPTEKIEPTGTCCQRLVHDFEVVQDRRVTL